MKGAFFQIIRSILYALLRLCSYPLRGITYLLLNHLIQYRKAIVKSNLDRAFSKLSVAERKRIKNQFYLHFAAYLLETIELMVINRGQLLKRITISKASLDALKQHYEQKKPVIILAGHNFNWEYCSIFPILLDHKVLVSYKTLRSPFWNRVIQNLRGRFGATMVDHKSIYLSLHRFKRSGEVTLTWLGGDQMPKWSRDTLIAENFLGQPTYFFNGLNEIARKTESVVYFQDIRKTSASTYEVELKLISEAPQKETAHFVTREYARLLEQLILEQPANWLWSHKRWKKVPDVEN